MKNLLVYTNPKKEFDNEAKMLIKIQIHNSLELGWRKEDIVLVTNFDYEYMGIKSFKCDDIYCPHDKTSNKLPVIVWLFKKGFFGNHLYWYHDLDAYQNVAFTEQEVMVSPSELGLTTYVYRPQWNCGVYFFRNTTEDIFDLWWQRTIDRGKRRRMDEKALKNLTDNGEIKQSRYVTVDPSFNIPFIYTQTCFRRAMHPFRVLHFHPVMKDPRLGFSVIDMFMYGKNRLGIPLMSDHLINVFNTYGIQ